LLLVWERINYDRQDNWPSFTLIYSNPNLDEIFVSLEILPEDIKQIDQFTPSSTAYEAFDVNGIEASYIENNATFLSKTDYYQELFWIENLNDQTVIYRVVTDSLGVTKEELLSIALNME
jgi:hypothetical protein